MSVSRRALLASSLGAALAPSLSLAAPAAPKGKKAGPPKLSFAPLELKLRHTWTIARGSADSKTNGLLAFEAEGVTGYGEAAPNKRWGQSHESGEAAFQRTLKACEGLSPWEHLAWLERAERESGPDSQIVCALDLALWDWKGKKLGVPVHRLLGVSQATMPVTSFSIGIDTPEVMAEKTKEAEPYPILKIKVGRDDVERNVNAVRSVTKKTIRVDANEGWSDPAVALEKLKWMKAQGVEFLEQPFPAGKDVEGMKLLRSEGVMPILADEPVLHPTDIPAIAPFYDGVVLKLAKCGGITRALEEIAICRAHGLRLMLGCMIESSLGIAAGVAVAPLFEWVDIDGNLLVSNDPWKGLVLTKGRWALPEGPGLGVSRA